MLNVPEFIAAVIVVVVMDVIYFKFVRPYFKKKEKVTESEEQRRLQEENEKREEEQKRKEETELKEKEKKDALIKKALTGKKFTVSVKIKGSGQRSDLESSVMGNLVDLGFTVSLKESQDSDTIRIEGIEDDSDYTDMRAYLGDEVKASGHFDGDTLDEVAHAFLLYLAERMSQAKA